MPYHYENVVDLKIMNPTEGKHKELAEPSEMRCAIEEDEPVTPALTRKKEIQKLWLLRGYPLITRRGMRSLPVGV